MTWHRAVRIVAGIGLVLLGLLWVLQGSDLVRIRPILCVADCQPVTGGSLAWLVIGLVTLVMGLGVAALPLPRRSPRSFGSAAER